MPHFYVVKFILCKLGFDLNGKNIFRLVIGGIAIAGIFMGLLWIKGILDQNERYAAEIKTYKKEIAILHKNEKKLTSAIQESRNKLEEISLDLKEKTKKFEEWKRKSDQDKYSNKLIEIFGMIDKSKMEKTLDACLNVNQKIAGLKYEDF